MFWCSFCSPLPVTHRDVVGELPLCLSLGANIPRCRPAARGPACHGDIRTRADVLLHRRSCTLSRHGWARCGREGSGASACASHTCSCRRRGSYRLVCASRAHGRARPGADGRARAIRVRNPAVCLLRRSCAIDALYSLLERDDCACAVDCGRAAKCASGTRSCVRAVCGRANAAGVILTSLGAHDAVTNRSYVTIRGKCPFSFFLRQVLYTADDAADLSYALWDPAATSPALVPLALLFPPTAFAKVIHQSRMKQ